MSPRRVAAGLALALLLVGAVAGVWRSARPDRPADPAQRLATELRCPACQGESVAGSRSPIAAAMRDAIGAQLAQGHSPAEVRAYLVRRYGPEVLAAPPARGLGLVLWGAPALALLAGLVPAVRAARRSRRAAVPPLIPPAGPAGPAGGARRRSAVRGRIWNIGAVCLLALVGGVALAAPRPPARAYPASDPVAGQLTLARSMEEQGHYDVAAEIYRGALRESPMDDIRLRLAFALIRGGQAGEAERLAGQVLASRPDTPDALLMLGLAQRARDPRAASATLRRFLTRAPDHPAAAEIRRLLDPGRSG